MCIIFPFYPLKRIIYCSKETFEENECFLVSYRLLGIDSKKSTEAQIIEIRQRQDAHTKTDVVHLNMAS